MPIRVCIAIVTLVAFAAPLAAQPPFADDAPKAPNLIKPLTKEQLDQRESLKLFALGLLKEREDRLIEAAELFAKASELDPKAVPILKALIALDLALDRGAEAIALTKKVLELAPDDAATWHIHGRQLRALGKTRDAIAAYERGLKCEELKEEPELAQQIHVDLGAMYEIDKQPAKAAQAFASAAALLEHTDALVDTGLFRPEEVILRCAEAYERVGRNCLEAKQFDQAIGAFRKAQAKYPAGAGRLNFNLALVCKEMGDSAQALNFLDAYLRFLPQGTEAFDLKIELLDKLKRGGEVLPWLTDAADKDRFNLGLKLLLARELGRAGQFDKAEAVYQQEAAKTPTPAIYRGLFSLYEQNPKAGVARALNLLDQTLAQAVAKDLNAAAAQGPARAMIAALREDKALTDKFIAAALSVLDRQEKLAPDTLQILGAFASQKREYVSAERLYRAGLKGLPPDLEALVYGGLLQALWKQRKYDDIVSVSKTGLAQAKAANRVLFHTNLARALACLSQSAAALAEVEKALSLVENGEKLGLRLLRTRILIQEDQFDKAVKECEAMHKDYVLPAEQMEVHFLLSTIYTYQKRFAQAEDALAECLKIDPNNATVHNDLGYLWADQSKNLDKAEEMIRKALDLDKKQRTGKPLPGTEAEPDEGDNAAFVDSLGWVLFRRGKLQEARAELERACRLPDSDDPVLWDHLGDVYRALEMREQAIQTWQRALHFCDQEKRRKMDERKKEIGRKIKSLQ